MEHEPRRRLDETIASTRATTCPWDSESTCRDSSAGGAGSHGPPARSGKVARTTGLEPATTGVTGRYSNRLSYVPTFSGPRSIQAAPRVWKTEVDVVSGLETGRRGAPGPGRIPCRTAPAVRRGLGNDAPTAQARRRVRPRPDTRMTLGLEAAPTGRTTRPTESPATATAAPTTALAPIGFEPSPARSFTSRGRGDRLSRAPRPTCRAQPSCDAACSQFRSLSITACT